MKAASILALAVVFGQVFAPAASAHNTWNGGYRKWPWRAGTDVTLGTLPGECPHCRGRESSSAWKAIDASMDYDTVYSIAPGSVSAFVGSGGAAGTYLRIKDADGTYVTYEHLSKALVTSGSVYAGQPIAISGESGNATGPHLHFQRQSGTAFSSTALDLTPISGHGGAGDALSHTGYTSDNAGIATASSGSVSQAMLKMYAAHAGYSTIGVTADAGTAWTPCNAEGATGTRWRYGCTPRTGVTGSVQTFFAGSGNRAQALMTLSGTSDAYVLHRGILAAYTESYDGHDWVYWIGYPTGNRYSVADGRAYRQDFQAGFAIFTPSSCTEDFYIGNTFAREYAFCD